VAKQPKEEDVAATARRSLITVLSVLVLGTTGYAWATLRDLDSGVSTHDVISKGPSSPDGATDILVIGNDSRTDPHGDPLPPEVLKALRAGDDGGSTNTDTMILVRIPNGGQRATAVSLPRDTLVPLGNGYGEHKLNSAMSRAKEDQLERLRSSGVTDPKQLQQQSDVAAQRFLIKTVEDLTGAHVDHYAEVNLLGFDRITRAVGGVDVCLKNPVNDVDYSGSVFPAGPQSIQGADALAFVRQRHGLPRGDLDRVVRQQVFLSGLARKMLSTGTLTDPSKLSGLVTAVRQALMLDAGWDVLGFAQQLQGITGGNIDFHTMPVELEGPSGQEDVVPDIGKVHRFVADLLLDPAARRTKQQAETARKAQRAKTAVSVFNATDVSGLAKAVLTTLTTEGFTPDTSANAAPARESSVHYAPGEDRAARQVSESLGGLPIRRSDAVRPGRVEVYLGEDYRGPASKNSTAARPIRWGGPGRSAPRPAQQPDGTDQPITAGVVACVN
jgi:LCP family protein required for cell wall assembly